jgi:hypothetical protein
MCPNCFHSLPTPQMAPPMVAAVPGRPQPGWYGPIFPFNFFKWRWLPVILVGVAAVLIMMNGVFLASATFFAVWAWYLPWVAFLGPVGIILGVMLGFVLLGALVLILLNFRVMAAFMIFPTAIVSLLIGGGFAIGAVLAVLAGILLLL